MTYAPRTDKTRWIRDQVLMVLREAAERPDEPDLTVGQLCARLGANSGTPFRSQDVYSTLASMERHREVVPWGEGIYRWYLGPDAPPPVDLTSLEARL